MQHAVYQKIYTELLLRKSLIYIEVGNIFTHICLSSLSLPVSLTLFLVYSTQIATLNLEPF